MACLREPRPRRVVLMFHALSGTNPLVTYHSPTGSQLKCYDWNRWFWVDSLSPRLPQKDFKVDKGVKFPGVSLTGWLNGIYSTIAQRPTWASEAEGLL